MRRRSMGTRAAVMGAAAIAGSVSIALAGDKLERGPPLPPVPYPAENPPTEAKRVLGKILFFEEQLSSDGTVACATCHVMAAGATDPRRERGPGMDGRLGNAGDVFGSPGVVAMDADGRYDMRGVAGRDRQVTLRTAPSILGAMYSEELMWDGRVGGTCVDPVSGATTIAAGGALEAQSMRPLVNSVEMGHAARDYADVVSQIAAATPLALADILPPDVASAILDEPSYPELFRRAFGTTEITASRMAMAIATYERTLVPNQTRYDRWLAGDDQALTSQEKRGLAEMTQSGCTNCHDGPMFTDGSFRTIGVRPPHDDAGREAHTGDRADRGAFKVPSLRNVALKKSFFHDGKRTDLTATLRFYRTITGPTLGLGGVPVANYASGPAVDPEEVRFLENADPDMDQLDVSGNDLADIELFLRSGLTDLRVAREEFPFDRPILGSERTDLSPKVTEPWGAPVVVTTPAFAGNEHFRVGVMGGPGGGTAQLVVMRDGAPVELLDPVALTTASDGGAATVRLPLTGVEPGARLQLSWRMKSAGSNHVSRSQTLTVPVFAKRRGWRAAPLPEPANRVDDADGWIESASFRVNWLDEPGSDHVSLVAHLNPRNVHANALGHLTVTVAGARVIDHASLLRGGEIQGPDAKGSFNPATGTLRVTVRNASVRRSLYATAVGGSGRITLPVDIDATDWGYAQPTVTAVIPFDWKGRQGRTSAGRYSYAKSGTQDGVFRISQVRLDPLGDDQVRVRVRAVLDGPGWDVLTAPAGLTLAVGEAPGFSLPPAALDVADNGTITARGVDGLRSLRIDAARRTLTFDAVVEDPVLAGAHPSGRARLRVAIGVHAWEGSPGATFTTTADADVR